MGEGREGNGAEVGFAVGGGKFPAGAEVRTTVLNGVATLFEVLHAVIEGHDPGDFFAHLPAGFAAEEMGALWGYRRCKLAQDLCRCPTRVIMNGIVATVRSASTTSRTRNPTMTSIQPQATATQRTRPVQ